MFLYQGAPLPVFFPALLLSSFSGILLWRCLMILQCSCWGLWLTCYPVVSEGHTCLPDLSRNCFEEKETLWRSETWASVPSFVTSILESTVPSLVFGRVSHACVLFLGFKQCLMRSAKWSCSQKTSCSLAVWLGPQGNDAEAKKLLLWLYLQDRLSKE